jgi:hypothetical protein
VNTLFPTGKLLQTPGARDTLVVDDVHASLARHSAGDWGDCTPYDRAANDAAILDLTRLVSVYRDRAGRKFFIITEADRSATTVLLPEEY